MTKFYNIKDLLKVLWRIYVSKISDDLALMIHEYEMDQLTFNQEIKLFSELIKYGHHERLQRHYYTMAQEFIRLNILDEDGSIIKLESEDGKILD